MRTKFDVNLLNTFATENDIKLIGIYENLTRESIIKGKCKTENCCGEFSKTFRMLLQNKGFYCVSCQKINSQTKMKATNLIKYGCEFNLDNLEVKQKRTNTFIEKYGGHPSKSNDIKQKKKETFIKNYGVEHNMKSEEFLNNRKEKFLEKHGVEHQMKLNEIKEKMKSTNLIKYGTECSLNNTDVRNKMIKNNIEKYGVEYPYQNPEIADTHKKSLIRFKDYILPSENIIRIQGYENYALDFLLNNENINENDIITSCKLVPEIWYNDNGKKRRHYVDIFIPNLNKCIEVKSDWTIKLKKDIIFIKQQSAKELGYEYEIWVYDRKGNVVNKYL